MARFYLIRPSTLAVLLFTSASAAQSAAEDGDLITGGGDTAKFEEVPTPVLLRLRNHAAEIGEGKEIKGFRDREAAVKAAGPVLEFLAKPGTPVTGGSTTAESTSAPTATESAQGAQENTTVASKTRKRAAKGATKSKKKVATGLRGRPSRFAGMVITRQQKENPRREGTRAAAAWDLIKDGMSYESYMEKGGNLEDLTREWERKRVKISRKG